MPTRRSRNQHNRSVGQSANGHDRGVARRESVMADGADLSAVESFDTLFRRHRGSLFAFVLRLARNEHVAADVCQQTWLKFLEAVRGARAHPTGGAAVHAYLTRVARNVYIDEYVRSHNVCKVESTDHHDLEQVGGGDTDDHSVEQTVEKAQLRALTREALATLPPLQTEVLRLWASGLSPTAVAASTRAPRDTILSRKKYGFAKLRNALLERGLTAELATAS